MKVLQIRNHISWLRCLSQCNQNRPRKNIYNFKISNSK